MPIREQRNIFSGIDKLMLLVYLLLIIIGWLNVYASAYNELNPLIIDTSQVYGKQMVWMGISLIIGFSILIIDSKFFRTLSYFFYFVTAILLIAVLFTGTEINGSKSWFMITETIRFQPSEFAKFTAALAIAKYLSDASIKIQELKTRLAVTAILGIPMFFIFLQNETGSILVFLSFIFVLYREGLSGIILIVLFILTVLFFLTLLVDKIIIIATIGIIAILFSFFIRRTKRNIFTLLSICIAIIAFVYSVAFMYEHGLSNHQKKRIDVLIGKEIDPKGAGYNVNQSMIAIGSGGLLGKGFLDGTQTKYKFVPEQNTDFIFCTVGEEWGFVGSLFVICLYVILLLRIIFAAERQRSAFARIYGYSLASILFFHFVINIGMTIGLAPVVGIPLPYLSYGGSSMITFSIMLFVFIKQDAVKLQIL